MSSRWELDDGIKSIKSAWQREHTARTNLEKMLENTEAENAKLRELVRDYIDAPCTTCDCWQDDFRCWNYDGADCGLVARARELGVEVDG